MTKLKFVILTLLSMIFLSNSTFAVGTNHYCGTDIMYGYATVYEGDNVYIGEAGCQISVYGQQGSNIYLYKSNSMSTQTHSLDIKMYGSSKPYFSIQNHDINIEIEYTNDFMLYTDDEFYFYMNDKNSSIMNSLSSDVELQVNGVGSGGQVSNSNTGSSINIRNGFAQGSTVLGYNIWSDYSVYSNDITLIPYDDDLSLQGSAYNNNFNFSSGNNRLVLSVSYNNNYFNNIGDIFFNMAFTSMYDNYITMHSSVTNPKIELYDTSNNIGQIYYYDAGSGFNRGNMYILSNGQSYFTQDDCPSGLNVLLNPYGNNKYYAYCKNSVSFTSSSGNIYDYPLISITDTDPTLPTIPSFDFYTSPVDTTPIYINEDVTMLVTNINDGVNGGCDDFSAMYLNVFDSNLSPIQTYNITNDFDSASCSNLYNTVFTNTIVGNMSFTVTVENNQATLNSATSSFITIDFLDDGTGGGNETNGGGNETNGGGNETNGGGNGNNGDYNYSDTIGDIVDSSDMSSTSDNLIDFGGDFLNFIVNIGVPLVMIIFLILVFFGIMRLVF